LARSRFNPARVSAAWREVSETTTLSAEELDQAQAVTEALSAAVGIREQQPEMTAQAVRDRQAAFTMFINTYDEICAAVHYVRRKYGDADSIAPSLYLGRASKRKSDDAADGRSKEPAAAAPAAQATATVQPAKADVASDGGPYMSK
jgi:hypothetical protein